MTFRSLFAKCDDLLINKHLPIADTNHQTMNSSTSVPGTDDTGQSGSNLIYFAVIAACVFTTQTIAYFASSRKIHRKYILNSLAVYTILVQWIVFLHAGGFFGNEPTEMYYDLTGSLTFTSTLALSLYFANGRISIRRIILSAFVAIWSIRLGAFLFTRIHSNHGIDSRFTMIKQSTTTFMMAWTMQGMWVFITMLPILILNQSISENDLGLLDFIGMNTWVIGFSIEVIADYQKTAFRKLLENHGKFISTGLWSISRHPNYFGEILLWTGIALSAFGGLSGGRPRAAFVFLSPIFVALLLIFVSGIPLLEEKANIRYGHDDAYQIYKKETPVLVPFIGRAGDAMF